MDLVCPRCQKRLTIEDRYAGMVVKCPVCSGMLQAPVLLTLPPGPAVIASAPSVSAAPQPLPQAPPYVATMPALTLPPAASQLPAQDPDMEAIPPASSSAPLPAPDAAEVPTVPQGDYTRKFRYHLRADILAWIVPGCVVAVFFLSFFDWHHIDIDSRNLWQLSFGERFGASYTFYTLVFVFAAQPLAIITLCLEKRWIPLPDGLRTIWSWRSVIVGGTLALPFLFLLGVYSANHFRTFGNPTTIAMKLAFRAHLVAVVSCALQVWLERRKATNQPLPRIDVRW